MPNGRCETGQKFFKWVENKIFVYLRYFFVFSVSTMCVELGYRMQTKSVMNFDKGGTV